jgi:hypothetical protein
MLGPKAIRGEIAVRGGGPTPRDFHFDRGKLVKRYAVGSLILLERDGTAVTVKVSASTRVTLNGRPSTLHALRAGMQIAVTHQDDLAADAVYASSPKLSPKLPNRIVVLLLGNKLMRAEIALKDTTLHDYRLDQGRIRLVTPTSITLREADGTDVPVDVSPSAIVRLNGQNASYVQLRKGMMAITIHDGDNPADQIFASAK